MDYFLATREMNFPEPRSNALRETSVPRTLVAVFVGVVVSV